MSKNKHLDQSAWAFGTEVITLDAGGAGQGSDVDCRQVKVMAEASKTAYVGNSSSVDNTYPVLPNTAYLPIEVNNTSLLYFSGTAGDKIYLIYLQ